MTYWEWDQFWARSRAFRVVVITWAISMAAMTCVMAINSASVGDDVSRYEVVAKNGDSDYVVRPRPAKWEYMGFIVYPSVGFAGAIVLVGLNGGVIRGRRRFTQWRNSEAVQNRKRIRELEKLSARAEEEAERLQDNLDKLIAA